jgi:uncharacterized protein (DUF1778 family)
LHANGHRRGGSPRAMTGGGGRAVDFAGLCAILAPATRGLGNQRGVVMTAATEREQEMRLVARANAEIHRIIQEAAELQGSTVSQFLLDAALDQPARPLPRLRQVAQRYMDEVDATDPERVTEQEPPPPGL